MTVTRTEEALTAGVRRMSLLRDGLRGVAVVIYGTGDQGKLAWMGPARTGPGAAYEVLTPGSGGLLTRSFEPPPLEVGALVASIRAALSLNVSQTAQVLGVQRPTLYAWMREEAEPQTANARRLGRVAGLALRWNELSGHQPLGRRLRLPVLGDRTVLDLLSEEEIREVPLIEALRRLSEEVDERAPIGGRSARAQRRLAPRPLAEQEADLDLETGAGFLGETAAD
jgi:transcriptional regulator with XRE-family HTH domain